MKFCWIADIRHTPEEKVGNKQIPAFWPSLARTWPTWVCLMSALQPWWELPSKVPNCTSIILQSHLNRAHIGETHECGRKRISGLSGFESWLLLGGEGKKQRRNTWVVCSKSILTLSDGAGLSRELLCREFEQQKAGTFAGKTSKQGSNANWASFGGCAH